MYNYTELIKLIPELSEHVKDGDLNYSSIKAVRLLNRALLLKEYNLKVNLPDGHLCPAVPNRTEYIRQIEFILRTVFYKKDSEIVGIDIGTGVSCVYPLIGCARNQKWTFLATDIDDEIIKYAKTNIEMNKDIISYRITLIKNDDSTCIFPSTLKFLLSTSRDKFVVCNPPFYADTADLHSRRAFKRHKPVSGQWEMKESELATELGGEVGFIKKMIDESKDLVHSNILLFSCMLGMKESLDELLVYLGASKHIKSFAYDLLLIKHTCRYLLFWSLSHQFPRDSGHRLRITAKLQRVQTISVQDDFNFRDFFKELQSKYGSNSHSGSKETLLLTHNKWGRKYRRSPSTAPPLNNPIELTIVHENNLVLFYLDDEADWEIFLGFVNHLRREQSEINH